MAFRKLDLTGGTTTSTGTGALVLDSAAVTGLKRFQDQLADGDTTYVMIRDRATGINEGALVTYSAGAGTLTRTTTLSSTTGSRINFPAGIKDITLYAPAAKTLVENPDGSVAVTGDLTAANVGTAGGIATLDDDALVQPTQLPYQGIIGVDTVADMAALVPKPPSLSVAGRDAAGDGGGGNWYWHDGDTAETNGIDCVRADDDTGCWRRHYSGAIDLRWVPGAANDGDGFGSGTSNSSALEAARVYLRARGGGRLLIPAGKYYFASQVTGDWSDISIVGEGAATILDHSGVVGGTGFFRPTGSYGDEVEIAADLERDDKQIETKTAHGLAANDWVLVESCINASTSDADPAERLCDGTAASAPCWFAEFHQVLSVEDATNFTLKRRLVFYSYPVLPPGGVTDKGEWDAATNTPTLVSSTGTTGDFYTVSADGTTTLDGTSEWEEGDQVIFLAGAWVRKPGQKKTSTIRKVNWCSNFTIENLQFKKWSATQVENNGTNSFVPNLCFGGGARNVTFDLGLKSGTAIRANDCYGSRYEARATRPSTFTTDGFDHSDYNSWKAVGSQNCHFEVHDLNGSQGFDETWSSHTCLNNTLTGSSINSREDGGTTHGGSRGFRLENFRVVNPRYAAFRNRARFATIDGLDCQSATPESSISGILLLAWGGLDTTVQNCIIDGAQYGFRFDDDAVLDFAPPPHNLAVKNNRFRNCTLAGVFLPTLSAATATLCGTVIQGNLFEKCADDCISIGSYRNGVQIIENTFKAMTGDAPVAVDFANNCSHPVVKGNIFDSIGASAIGIRTGYLSALSTFPQASYKSLLGALNDNTFIGPVGQRTFFEQSPIDQALSVPSGINVLRNPAMRIAKRGTSISDLGANGDYAPLDGWQFSNSLSAPARWTVSQESGGGVSGGESWMKLLCTTADAAPATGMAQVIRQYVEGQMARPLVGTSNRFGGGVLSAEVLVHKDAASSLTFPVRVSFVVRSFDGDNRQFVGSAYIRSADVWQRIAISLPPDATVQLDSDTGAALYVGVTLYSEASTGSLNAWANSSSSALRDPNSPNLADATGNYIGLTRIKFEPAEVETPFRLDQAADEALCERYLCALDASVVGSGEAAAAYRGADSTTIAKVVAPTRLRSGAVTLTATASKWLLNDGAATTAITALAIDTGSRAGLGRFVVLTCTVASGLTQFRPYSLRENGSGNGLILLDRELSTA